jgi:hypothetical protein
MFCRLGKKLFFVNQNIINFIKLIWVKCFEFLKKYIDTDQVPSVIEVVVINIFFCRDLFSLLFGKL